MIQISLKFVLIGSVDNKSVYIGSGNGLLLLQSKKLLTKLSNDWSIFTIKILTPQEGLHMMCLSMILFYADINFYSRTFYNTSYHNVVLNIT